MYKELVEKLRHRGTLYNGISLFDDAANAIEKLLFKYNFANMTKKETDITLKNEFLKCLRLEAENKELKRERDQAVEELHRNTDAVPVVRCKDCKWFTMDNTGGAYCNHLTCGLFNGYEPDAFCSYGERKESNE
jgi:hypothetical protein